MNIVDLIKDQLSSGVINQLSSLIGESETKTTTAVGAAVPAMLSGLSNLASTGSGAQKLASALSGLDPKILSNLGGMLSGQGGSLVDQGGGLLNSLFGGNILSGVVSALARFAGLGSGSAQKLLSALAPIVLSVLAGRFAGKAINPQGLASLFAEQKNNIANAMPSGLSLADVPGMGTATAAARDAYGAAQEAGSSLPKWLWPVLGLAALALVLWWLFGRGTTPAVPDVAKVSSDLTGSFKSVTDSLTGITDAASAEKALPKLKELSTQLDGMKALVDKLPEAGKTKITDLIKTDLGKLDDQFAKLLWIPGVGDKIKGVVSDIMGKFAKLGGVAVPQVSQASGDLAGMVSSLTETLTGVKDADTAKAALPKLEDLDGKLAGMKTTMDKMGDAGKSTIRKLIDTALIELKKVVDRVLALAGAGDTLKPVMNNILGKLTALGG